MPITYKDLRDALDTYDRNKSVTRKLKKSDQDDIARLKLLVRTDTDSRLSAYDFGVLIHIIQSNSTKAGHSARQVIESLKSKIEGWDYFTLDINRAPYFNIVNPYRNYYPSPEIRDAIVNHRFPLDVAHIFNTLHSLDVLSLPLQNFILKRGNENLIRDMHDILTDSGSYYLFQLLIANDGHNVLKTMSDAQLLKISLLKKIINEDDIKRRTPIDYLTFNDDLTLLACSLLLTEEKFKNILAFYSRIPQPKDSMASLLMKYKIFSTKNLDAVYSIETHRITIIANVLEALRSSNVKVEQLSIDEILSLTTHWNSLPVNNLLRAWGHDIYEVQYINASNIVDGIYRFHQRVRHTFNPNILLNSLLQERFSMPLWQGFTELFIVNHERARLGITLLSLFHHLHPRINLQDLFSIGLLLDPNIAWHLLIQLPELNQNTITWNHLVRLCRAANGNQQNAMVAFQQFMGTLLWREVQIQPPRVAAPRHEEVNYSQSIHNKFVEESAAESAIRLFERYGDLLKQREKYRREILAWANTLGATPEELAAKKAIIRITDPLYAYTNEKSQISTDQLIILTWIAIHDDELRGFGMNPDQKYRQSVFTLKAAKEALVNAYYQIQRGYNLDDKGNEIQIGEKDSPICTGGTFIKILEKLVGFHPDIVIKFMTQASASEQLPGAVRAAAMDYLRALPETKYNKAIALIKEESASGSVSPIWKKIKPTVKKSLKAYAALYAEDKNPEAKFQEFIENGQYAGLSNEDLKKVEIDRNKKPTARPEIPRLDLEGMRAARVRMFDKGKQHADDEDVITRKKSPPKGH